MIKIVKPGTKKKIECDECGAILSYDITDIEKHKADECWTLGGSIVKREYESITCPQCKHKIILSATR